MEKVLAKASPFFFEDIALIGRFVPVTSISPEIDLSTVDVRKSVFRRNAKIQHAEGVFIVDEEVGVKNGTLLNGKQIPKG